MTNRYVKNMLGDNEEVLLVTRQHGLVLLKNILAEVVLILVFCAAIAAVLIFLIPTGFLAILVWIVGGVILLFPIIGMVHDILVWTNKQFIITSRRVIQVAGIINKNVTDSSLEKVNDVKMMQSFWGRLFNYGDIEILTASELGVNLFRKIGNPVKVKTTMLNAKNRLANDDVQPGKPEVKVIPAEVAIPDMLAELDELKKKGIITEEEFQEKKKELLARY
ncbi:MAG: PH domain-containing protein [Anaerolineaceae bacterium]